MALALSLALCGCAGRATHDYRSPLHMIKDSDRWSDGHWVEPEEPAEPIRPVRTIEARGEPGTAPHCDARCGCFAW